MKKSYTTYMPACESSGRAITDSGELPTVRTKRDVLQSTCNFWECTQCMDGRCERPPVRMRVSISVERVR
jgi:hypothetical protein